MSIDNPLNVATPLTAATVAVPLSVPLLGLVPIARVTFDVFDVTVLPPASCTVTTGWVLQAVPPVPPVVGVVTANFDAEPTVILKPLLVAPVNDPSVTLKV